MVCANAANKMPVSIVVGINRLQMGALPHLYGFDTAIVQY
jgi:hypothetical protein